MKFPGLHVHLVSKSAYSSEPGWYRAMDIPQKPPLNAPSEGLGQPEQPIVTAVAAKVLADKSIRNLGELQAKLEDAFFGNAEMLAPRDRKRFVFALTAIAEFMNASHMPVALGKEITDFALALLDLDKGLVSSTFKAAPRGKGNLTDVGEIWRARVYLAIAVDALIGLGIKKKDAYQRVATRIDFISHHLVRDGSDFELAIRRWFETFADRKCPDHVAQSMFDDRQELVKRFLINQPGSTGLDVASHVMDCAVASASRSSDAEAHKNAKALLARRLGRKK